MSKKKIFIYGLIITLLVSFSEPLYYMILGRKIVGRIVKFEILGNKSFRAIALYKINNNVFYTKSEENIDFKPGEQVTILYIPSQPHKAKIFTFLNLFLNSIIYFLTLTSILIVFVNSYQYILNTINHRNQKLRKKVIFPDNNNADLPGWVRIFQKFIIIFLLALLIIALLIALNYYFETKVYLIWLMIIMIVSFIIYAVRSIKKL